MTRKIAIIGAAVGLLASVALTTPVLAAPGEQVWDAELVNTQKTCGIDYATGSSRVGGILTQGETQSSGSKGIVFDLKTNAKNLSWKITEAKLTQNTGRFDFSDNLIGVSDRTKTSLVVNDQEYAWTDVTQERQVQAKSKQLTLAPKINLAAQEFPLGTTHIQGKIVVTCSD